MRTAWAQICQHLYCGNKPKSSKFVCELSDITQQKSRGCCASSGCCRAGYLYGWCLFLHHAVSAAPSDAKGLSHRFVCLNKVRWHVVSLSASHFESSGFKCVPPSCNPRLLRSGVNVEMYYKNYRYYYHYYCCCLLLWAVAVVVIVDIIVLMVISRKIEWLVRYIERNDRMTGYIHAYLTGDFYLCAFFEPVSTLITIQWVY
jgi:hypothetical protein